MVSRVSVQSGENAHQGAQDRIDALERENVRLRKALAQYADPENWQAPQRWCGDGEKPWKVASDALSGQRRR